MDPQAERFSEIIGSLRDFLFMSFYGASRPVIFCGRHYGKIHVMKVFLRRRIIALLRQELERRLANEAP
jgi:hypothetical protein